MASTSTTRTANAKTYSRRGISPLIRVGGALAVAWLTFPAALSAHHMTGGRVPALTGRS
jgi:hypothetical protein